MSTFLVGTNRFENCDTLIAHRGVPVLRIDAENGGVSIDLQMPEGTEPLHVERNRVTTGTAAIVASPHMVTLLKDETLLVHAVRTSDGSVLVDLDLRPLRAAIHTDGAGLHIGSSVLAGNVVQGARVAISLS